MATHPLKRFASRCKGQKSNKNKHRQPQQFRLNRRLRLFGFLAIVYVTAAILVVVTSLGLEPPRLAWPNLQLPSLELASASHVLTQLIPPAPTKPTGSASLPLASSPSRPAPDIFPAPMPEPRPHPSNLPTASPTNNPNSQPNLQLPPQVPGQAATPRQFRGRIIQEAAVNNRKVVALTFDDGPWPITPQFLTLLQQQQVKSTFFLIGRHLKKFPDIGRQIALAGHALGNHSWSHRFSGMSDQDVIAEIENTSALINKITGIRTDMFRPPGGFLDNGLVDYATQKKYLTAMWTVDPVDTKPGITAKAIAAQVLQQTKPGSVILLHDGGGGRQATLQALPQIIAGLKKKGYTFVTLPELLQLQVQIAQTTKPTPTKPAPQVAQPNAPAAKPSPAKAN